MTLTPEHSTYLEGQGVDPAVAEALGVRSILSLEDLPDPFKWLNGKGTPSILYPYAHNGRQWPQLHPDTIPVIDGKERKYLFPKDESPLLWHVHEPERKPEGVLIVEGTKQALAVASTRPAWRVLALAGCWMWMSKGKPLASLYGAAEGLPVVVALDGDRLDNPDVYDSSERMVNELPVVMDAESVKMAPAVGSKEQDLADLLGDAPKAQRLPFVERLIRDAVPRSKLGQRPRDPDPRVASGLFTMRPNRAIALLVDNVAQELDRIAPWAWQESGDGLWRYNATTGVYEFVPVKSFGAHLSHLLGNDYEGRFDRDVIPAVKSYAARQNRILDPMGASSHLVPVTNGVLDPKTGELHPHSPDHLLLGAWATPYVEGATCPAILAYLEQQFPGQVDAILDTLARVLDRVNPQDRTLFLFGPPRTGKSTVMRIVERMVGRDGCSNVSLHQLAGRPFAAAQLYGKSLNTFADLSAREVQDTSTFKALTGGDAIEAERKHEQLFRFTNRALLVFSANEVPALPADSEAEFARFVPVEAANSFQGAEDPAVEAALMAELPGLLAELVRRYQAGRKPQPAEGVKLVFRLAADKVARYISQRLDVWPADRPWKGAPKGSDVHSDFERWCQDEGVKSLSASRLYQGLRKNGVHIGVYEGNQHVKATIKGRGGGGKGPLGGLGGPPDNLRARARDEGEVSDPLTENNVGQKSTKSTGPVTVDFETPSADSLGSGDHQGPFCRLMSWADTEGAHSTDDPDEMRRVLTGASSLVTHNGWAFDMPAAALDLGLDVEELVAKTEDVMIRARLESPPRKVVGADRDRYGLADLAPAVLGPDRVKGDALPTLKRRHGGYDRIPTDDPEYRGYAELDAELTRDLWAAFPTAGAYYERERRVAGLAASLTVRGLRVDVAEVLRRIGGREDVAMDALAGLAEMGFPAASSPSARPWTAKGSADLLDGMARQAWGRDWPRTAKGAPRSDRELLTLVAEKGGGDPQRFAGLVLAITNAGGPFLPAVSKHLRASGRIHPQHKLQSATGRWSTSAPNTLGSGKRSKLLLAEREVILAEPGEVFVAVDLAGIDQRAVWGLSGDEAYGDLFAPGVDIHDEMAKMYFGEVTKPLRDASKAITHGIPYGRGPKAIANALLKSPGKYFGKAFEDVLPDVREALDSYFVRYAGVKAWQEDVRRRGELGEVMDNGFGRGIRVAPDEAYTESPARLAQSAARDLAMEGLLRIQADGLWPMVREFIHDEVLLSVPEDRAEEIGRRVAELMSFEWESPSGLTIPVTAVFDGKVGPRWSDCY